MATFRRGSELRPEVQAECLRRYCHRYTGEHTPAWARETRPNGEPYPVQFASDADWLANTRFAVNRDGTLNNRVKHCEDNPTWPNGNRA